VRFATTHYFFTLEATAIGNNDKCTAKVDVGADTPIATRAITMIKLLPALLAIMLFPTAPSHAAAPPKEPILRLDPGMHTEIIKGMSMDQGGRFLATASNDKTVKIWEYENGSLRLLRTLRPPIGEGDEGKIYAVAVSPDGTIVACGGWTGWDWEGQACIYLFNLRTGSLTGRITCIPTFVNHLSFSPDGRFLAASLQQNFGIRLYRTKDLTEAGKAADYGDQSYGNTFYYSDKGDLRLATTSYDGNIRLYAVGSGAAPLRLIAKVKAPGGKKPNDISASQTGRVAVGYDDTTNVDIFFGDNLAHSVAADTKGINNGNLGCVAWSSDGQTLYAGGRYWINNKVPIFSWSSSGKGQRKEAETGITNTIMSIVPLPDDTILVGSAEPAISHVAKEQGLLIKKPETADFRDNHQGFMLSQNGDKVRFGYKQWGKSPAIFDIASRSLISESVVSNLKPSVISDSYLNITDWDSTNTPKLNGAPLKLEQYETSLSLAIGPNASWFVLGTEWYLHTYNRDGSERWKVPAPGDVVGLNISGDGSVVVAAYGDGTIRWYRSSDSKEILALYPHPDQKRWVLWTPSGYYDASPGAEELIGWHVNNGVDQAADFFSASRFRNRFYRPDIIAKMLTTLDESEAVRLANQESGRRRQEVSVQETLPPVVTIISPLDGAVVSTSEITARFTVRTPSGEPITGIRALVNGRPVATTRDVRFMPQYGEQRELRVTIPEEEAEVSIIAENRFAASEPATVRIKWDGTKKREGFTIKPKLYVLAVGVSKYQNPNLVLEMAAKDARDFAATMQNQQGGIYREVVVKVLTDDRATKDNILDGLDWIQKETTSKDVAMVFFSGHGVNDSTGVYYYLPVNVDIEKMKRNAVMFTDIKNTVQSLAGKALFFIDTCHSGNVMGTRRGQTDITAVVNELSSAENGAVVFASSTGNQYSLEDTSWGNGAFTKALVEGINGKADYTGKGTISVNMLDLYLSERVKDLTKGKQTPTTTKPQTIQDFPVAMKR
jgi:WD40 repeat protein